MWKFSNIDNTGFTYQDLSGKTTRVSQSYNHPSGTGFLFRLPNQIYEIFQDRIILRTDKSCTFQALQPLQEWVITHNLQSTTFTVVTNDNGEIVYPAHVFTTPNENRIEFSSPVTGRAEVRVT